MHIRSTDKKMLTIEKASRKEIPQLVKIHKKCILETNSKAYDKSIVGEWIKQVSERNVLDQFENSEWVVGWMDQHVVGFCQFSLQDRVLYQIQVLPKYQGLGVGKSLYLYIEKQFVSHKICKISLLSTLNAVSFYEKLGFVKTADTEFPLNNHSIKMVKMEKALC